MGKEHRGNEQKSVVNASLVLLSAAWQSCLLHTGDAVHFISIEAFLYVHLPGSLCFEERIKDLLSSAAKDKTQWGSWSAIREE